MPTDHQRQECWDSALNAFGTAHIFERRGKALSFKLKVLTFLGVAVPAAIGAVVASFGTDFVYIGEVLIGASILGLGQLICSIWALVAGWEQAHAHAWESQALNTRLSDEFRQLASQGANMDFAARYAELKARSSMIEQNDTRQAVSEKEKRRGMRAGLRKFRRICAGCDVEPKDMKPTTCPVCGQF